MDGAHPFRPRSSLTPVHPRASPVVDPMLSSAHGASFHRLEEERRSVLVDLQARQQAHVALEADVKRLYKELEQERAETFEQTRQLRERLEHARREGANLELQILKSEIGASDKGEEVEEVKHQVEVKTKEIVKAMQRLSDQHRSAFQHVATLTSDMLRACSSRSPASNDLLQQGVQTKGHEVKQAPAKLVHPPSEEGVELPWFQAMKANLEEYGDVEVFLDQQPQECMSCCQAIEASYRARPRKCSHVFHVECLLHCWSEGTCPVCGASFAPEVGGHRGWRDRDRPRPRHRSVSVLTRRRNEVFVDTKAA